MACAWGSYVSKFKVALLLRHHEISRGGRLFERGPSIYQSVHLHCGVECSLHARFCGDWPSSFGVIDVTDRQTDQTFIDRDLLKINNK